MTKRFYRGKRFQPAALDIIAKVNKVVTEYLDQGLRLTLRQLYYQLVVKNWIKNAQSEYKRLSDIVSDGRLAGLIDWEAIEDRGRQPKMPSEFKDLDELIRAAESSYRLPRWAGQNFYVELAVEKDALAGVLAPIAREWHVPLMVNKGYSSQSAMYEWAQRMLAMNDCEPVILYLGDHDPSGEDMVRDIRERMEMFGVDDIVVEKIGLTMAQINAYKPPPNPAKITDPRAGAYIAKHGPVSWEVDALPPPVLKQIVEDAILEYLDTDKMDEVKEREDEDKAKLRAIVGKK